MIYHRSKDKRLRIAAFGLGHKGLKSRPTLERRSKKSFRKWMRRNENKECQVRDIEDGNYPNKKE